MQLDRTSRLPKSRGLCTPVVDPRPVEGWLCPKGQAGLQTVCVPCRIHEATLCSTTPGWQWCERDLGPASGSGSRRWPEEAQTLEEAEEDALAFMAFPRQHWSWICCTNPVERLNEEVKCRTDVVGVFPDQSSAEQLVGSVLMEIGDEWHSARSLCAS